jgi:hypothetical protein
MLMPSVSYLLLLLVVDCRTSESSSSLPRTVNASDWFGPLPLPATSSNTPRYSVEPVRSSFPSRKLLPLLVERLRLGVRPTATASGSSIVRASCARLSSHYLAEVSATWTLKRTEMKKRKSIAALQKTSSTADMSCRAALMQDG